MPCPGGQSLLEELWATGEPVLCDISASLPLLAWMSYYAAPWRQGLLEAKAGLHQALALAPDDGQEASRRLAVVRALAQERGY